MTLPLEAHPYGEHDVAKPPSDQTLHDGADVPLDTRLQIYRSLQELSGADAARYLTTVTQLLERSPDDPTQAND